MTICEELSERMPAVARGEAHWDATALAHLAVCRECAAEWRVVSAVAALGRAAPAIDPEAVGRLVLRRLAASGGRRRRARRWLGAVTGLAAAAAIVLMLWSPTRRVVSEPEAPVFLPELDSLTAVQLESVLGSVDRPLGTVRTLDAPGLSGLSDDQLADVLQSMEG